MKVVFLALLFMFSSQVFAQERLGELNNNIDRLILDVSLDDETKVHPDIHIPFTLNHDISAAISYYSTATYENEKVLNIADSKKKSDINYKTLNVYPVLWKLEKDVVGLDIQVLDIDKKQSGFFTIAGQTTNFTNDLSIQMIKPSLFYRFNNLTSKDTGAIYNVSISPYSKLDVSQSTAFTGALNLSGSRDGDSDSSFSFRAGLDGRYKFPSGRKSYYDFQYEYLPLKYKLDVLDTNGQFNSESFDVVEHIIKASYKISLDMNLFGLKPVLGVGYEITNGEEKNASDHYSYERFMLVFGIED